MCTISGSTFRRKQKIRTLLQSETGSDFYDLVDLEGFEPLTSRMRTERSSMSIVNTPHKKEEF